jgi:hypothetical protein
MLSNTISLLNLIGEVISLAIDSGLTIVVVLIFVASLYSVFKAIKCWIKKLF